MRTLEKNFYKNLHVKKVIFTKLLSLSSIKVRATLDKMTATIESTNHIYFS